MTGNWDEETSPRHFDERVAKGHVYGVCILPLLEGGVVVGKEECRELAVFTMY